MSEQKRSHKDPVDSAPIDSKKEKIESLPTDQKMEDLQKKLKESQQ